MKTVTQFKVKYANKGACQFCGLDYVRYLKTEQTYHRSFHKKVTRVVFPKPLKLFNDRILKIRDPELVTVGSPHWMHIQMYGRARVFKKEFGYDFTQWSNGRDYDFNAHGFLMRGSTRSGENCIVGACAFREYKKGVWTLTWVWVCPEARHSGVLSSRWSDFLQRFGDFEIDRPLSKEMKQFVLKYGTKKQKADFGDYLTQSNEEED